jgi:protein phosphatase PTC7
MEKLEQIQQTLSEIDDRTPDALRVAFSLGHRVSPAPAPGEEDRVASFAASVLPPPPLVSEDTDANEPGQVPLASTSEDDAAKMLRMEWASCYLPDHDEDAHFGHDEAGVLGVADGVGSYRNRGVDAAAFSRGLMTSAFMHVLAIEPGTPVCPYTLLERAYDETVASAASGASTAVIFSLAGATLKWAYIGDSAFAVLRGGKIVHRSRAQQSHFNCPFQISAGGKGDSVAKADVGEMPVRDGDVVVAGTDGLFDNVFDAELERVVRMGTAQGYSPKNMADVVAGIAYEMSRSRTKVSPFSTEYQKQAAGVGFHGGKPDDITVVVAFVRDLSSYICFNFITIR